MLIIIAINMCIVILLFLSTLQIRNLPYVNRVIIEEIEITVSVKRNRSVPFLTKNEKLNKVFYSPYTINYEDIEFRIIERLINGFGIEKNKYIIHEPRTYSGFGNQVRSLVGSIATALVTGRKLRIINNSYFAVTDTAFHKLAINSISDVINMKECIRVEILGGNPKVDRITDEFKNKTKTLGFLRAYPQNCVILYSNQDIEFIAQTVLDYQQVYKEFNLTSYEMDARSILTRLVLQPTNELLLPILSTLENTNLQQCLAVQIRTGGDLASHHEKAIFMSMPNIEKHMKIINEQFAKNESIYLSTDSEKLIPIVTNIMSNHEVIVANYFNISHSGFAKNNKISQAALEGTKRGILDVIVASHCQEIFYTEGSSFGRMITFLSFHKKIHIMKKT